MRISDWSSDVCSSDLPRGDLDIGRQPRGIEHLTKRHPPEYAAAPDIARGACCAVEIAPEFVGEAADLGIAIGIRSEEHTSELQSLMRISYAVFCLKKKHTQYRITSQHYNHLHS